MKKRRLFWTLIMLALMLLSFLTMFLPWIRVLDGSGAALPGLVLRRVLMVVTGLAFAGSLFFFFARRTAWGLVYLLVQALNLLVSCLVMRGANPEGGTAVYGVTGWFGVCIFLTAGAAGVWLAGLIAGAWKRQEAGAPARKKARGIPFRRKADEKNEDLPLDDAQKRAAELDDEYAEALAIAEAAELEKKKEAARLAAAARSEGAGGRPGEASAAGVNPAQAAKPKEALPGAMESRAAGALPGAMDSRAAGALPGAKESRAAGALPGTKDSKSAGVLPGAKESRAAGALPGAKESRAAGALPADVDFKGAKPAEALQNASLSGEAAKAAPEPLKSAKSAEVPANLQAAVRAARALRYPETTAGTWQPPLKAGEAPRAGRPKPAQLGNEAPSDARESAAFFLEEAQGEGVSDAMKDALTVFQASEDDGLTSPPRGMAGENAPAGGTADDAGGSLTSAGAAPKPASGPQQYAGGSLTSASAAPESAVGAFSGVKVTDAGGSLAPVDAGPADGTYHYTAAPLEPLGDGPEADGGPLPDENAGETDLAGEVWDDYEDEPDTSAYFLDDDDEEDEGPLDEEEEAEDEDFMDALGGFLGSFFSLTKNGVTKAARGIRAGAAGIKEKKSRKSGPEPAETEDGAGAENAYGAEMPEKPRSPKKTYSSETPEKIRGTDENAAKTEDVYGSEMPEKLRGTDKPTAKTEDLYGSEASEDRRGRRSADEIAAAIAGEDPENKDRFRIFGRVQRDETEEEPEFLRKRRKKAPKKAQKSDVKKGFVPSLGMVVKGLIALGAILVIGIAAFLLVRRFKLEKIDLRDYVVISSSGYEGYGKADITVDREALVKALADALARKGQIKPGSGTSVEAFRAFEHYNTIMTQLTVTTDKADHLSNGDEVTASFALDNEVMKEFGLKLEPESISHTVRGLRAVRQYSPFDSDLIVAFSGTEPYGQIVLTWAGDYPLHFTESRSDGLSNGDVVEVTAVPDDGYDAEALATECGIILSETSREFTVAGLSNYLRETGSLGGSVFGALDAEARDIVAKEAAGHYGKNETMTDCDYVGAAVLTGTEVTAVRNYLYMLYQLTYERGETTFSYYYYVRFEDVILHMDGGYERGEAFEVPEGRHGLFGLMDNDDALRIDWLHAVVGFSAVEDFYERKVAPLLETYTIDTDLGIDGIPAQALTASESGGTTAVGTAEQAAAGTAETASGTASAETASGTASAEPAPGTVSAETASGAASAETAPGTASAETAIAPEDVTVTSV